MAWKTGPMPKDTYGWGGVVPTGTTGGFFFADFKGDHVVLPGSGPDGADRTVKPEDVAFYDNSLTLPPNTSWNAGERL